MFFGLWRSKKKKPNPLKPPGGAFTKFEYFIIALCGFASSIYTWYPTIVPNPNQIKAGNFILSNVSNEIRKYS